MLASMGNFKGKYTFGFSDLFKFTILMPAKDPFEKVASSLDVPNLAVVE